VIEQRILELPTPRLLAYFKKHYRNRRGVMEYNCANEYSHITEADLAAFITDFDTVKAELNRRENVNA